MKRLFLVSAIAIILLVVVGVVSAMVPKESTVASELCRWTGGGTIGFYEGMRVTHGFELHCSVDQLPNKLEVNWGGNHFHLDALTDVGCWYNPAICPLPPAAGCDTIWGKGTGSYNGDAGYNVEFHFEDAGEPGTRDWAWIEIKADTTVVLEVSGDLLTGNQQAHNCTGIDAR